MKSKIHVGIVDMGINNLYTIIRSLKNTNYKVSVANSLNKFNFDALIIPGTGSFSKAMKKLKKEKLDEKIYKFHSSNRLILGICLGMQLLFEKSCEFGNSKGLSLIDGEIKRLSNIKCSHIPHTRWNSIEIKNKSVKNLFEYKRNNYYFVHSYFCEPKSSKDIACFTEYDKFKFCSVIFKNKLIGTQFHPEKSGDAGIKFFNNLKKFI